MGRTRKLRPAEIAAQLIGEKPPSTGRMFPWLQWFVVCNRVEQHGDGGVTLHRTLSTILVPEFPSRVRFTVTASFYHGDGEPYRYDLVMLTPVGPPQMVNNSFPVPPEHSQETAVDIVIDVSEPMTYFLTAFLEYEIVCEAKLEIALLTGAVDHEVTH